MGRKLIMSLITNRFGIVLAALNLSFFASQISSASIMKHTVQETVFICMNIPAIFAALVSSSIVELFVRLDGHADRNLIAIIFVSIYLVAQWLLIAHVARIGANYLRSKWQGF